MTMNIKGARLGAAPDGFYRVLVDRLWPRGVRRAEAPFDEWIKDVAPSSELRRWYGHDPARYETFATRYRAELQTRRNDPPMQHLLALLRARPVVLLTATRILELSQVPILVSFLASEVRAESDSSEP